MVWDLHERCCLPALDGHKSGVNAVVWSPDGEFLVTGGQDCTLRVWRASTGRQHAFFMADAAITCCCFSGAHRDIIAAGDAAGAVHYLDFPDELHA